MWFLIYKNSVCVYAYNFIYTSPWNIWIIFCYKCAKNFPILCFSFYISNFLFLAVKTQKPFLLETIVIFLLRWLFFLLCFFFHPYIYIYFLKFCPSVSSCLKRFSLWIFISMKYFKYCYCSGMYESEMQFSHLNPSSQLLPLTSKVLLALCI